MSLARRIAGAQGLGGSLALAAAVAALLFAGASAAVLIAGPDGTINTTPPVPDPGFGHVGNRGGLGAVYVRNGWVLTAAHVGAGQVTLDGVVYEMVPGSTVQFDDGATPADLIAFKLDPMPPLPDLVIASSPPAVGDPLVLIGRGRNRGAATSWQDPQGGPPPPPTWDGWELGAGAALRWGTNEVALTEQLVFATEAFAARFDDLNGQQADDPEAQVVVGDSGGAVFRWDGGVPALLGILFAASLHQNQPSDLALFGNYSVAADLPHYRSQIEAIIDQPGCSDGLDDDGDGLVDHPADPGCASPTDSSELDPAVECDNGVDDDDDGFVDFPDDPDCSSVTDTQELPEPDLAAGLALGVGLLGRLGRRAPRLKAP